MRIHILEHASFEGPANIERWALGGGHAVFRTRVFDGGNLPAQSSFDWLIVMGGPMGVSDEDRYPWLVGEKLFIEKAIAAGKVVLGICLGAQLIADVAGGRVYKNSHREIGWFPVTLTEEGRDSPAFAGMSRRFTPIHWHGDTFDLPAGAKGLGFSEATPNQAFEFGGKAFGIQFHIEWSRDDIAALTDNFRDELVTSMYVQSPDAILAREDHMADLHRTMEIILGNIARTAVTS